MVVNTLRGWNATGIVIVCFGLAGIVFLRVATFPSASPLNALDPIARTLPGAVIAIGGLLLALAVSKVTIDDEQAIVTKGIGPFVTHQRIDLSGPKEVRLSGSRGRYGPFFVADLFSTGGKSPIRLLSGGDETALKEVVDLARGMRIPVHADPSMRDLAPSWLKSRLPESFVQE